MTTTTELKEETIKVGSGTVRKRYKKNGKPSFQARFRKNGVNISDTFTELKEAKAFIINAESNLIQGKPITSPKLKKTDVGVILQEFIDNNKLPDLQKKRIQRTIAELTGFPLENFRTKAFQKYIDTKLSQDIPEQKDKKKSHKNFNGGMIENEKGELVRRKYSPSTVRKIYYDLRLAFQWHSKVNDYHFDSKPFDDVKAPPAWSKPRERRLEDGELEKLLKACDTLKVNIEETKLLLHFLIYSAFRIGETFKIKFKDIRLNENNPEESYIFIPKENQKIADKKGAKDRYANIRPELYKLIKEKILPRKKSGNEIVFSMWSSPAYFYTRFKTICKSAEIKDLTDHDLRHEGVSWFFENTMLSDIEIGNITGHLDLKTLRRYANLRPHKTGAKLWNSIANM